MFKILSRFKKCSKKLIETFCFSDSFIWIDIVELPLLRTGYFSSTANVLTSRPKIWDVDKRDLFEHNFLASDQWIWLRCYDPDFNSDWARLPCCLLKASLKGDFLGFYITMLPVAVISEIEKLWGSFFFFWKCFKF